MSVCKVFWLMMMAGIALGAHAEMVDRIAAVVNQEVITESEIDRILAFHLSELRKLSTPEEKALRLGELRHEAMDKLIEQKLLGNKIDSAAITVSPDELSSTIKRILAENQMGLEEFKQELNQNNVSFEAFKEDLTRQLKQSKFLQTEIRPKVQLSDADLLEHYHKHLSEFQSFKQISFTQVHIATSARRSINEALRVAQALKADAEKKQAYLSDMMNTHKSEPAAIEINESGWVTSDDLNRDLLRLLRTLEPKQVSHPIPVQAGVLLVQVKEWREPYTRPFEEVKGELQETLYAQKLDITLKHYLANLRQHAYIRIMN